MNNIQLKKNYSDFNFIKKIFFWISVFLVPVSIFMFFYQSIPQIEQDVRFIPDKFNSLIEPKNVYVAEYQVPKFDGQCLFSRKGALLALENNNFNPENIEFVEYVPDTLSPLVFMITQLQCWDRVVGSTYQQGTILNSTDKIVISYYPFPRTQFLIFSFILFCFISDFYKSIIKIFKPILRFYEPLYNNFHIFLFLLTIYGIFEISMNNANYFLFYSSQHLLFAFSFFVISYLFIIKETNLSIIIFSLSASIFSYLAIFVQKTSISKIFTDTDVYMSQLPISYLQFNQAKLYSTFYTWNPYFGAGYELEGQYATNYVFRKLIFFLSPNFDFASNFYFFFHITFAIYFFVLFLKELNISHQAALLGSLLFLTSNQVILWSPFIHYPAFLLGLTMSLFAIVSSKKNKFFSGALLVTAFYILSTGAHLQNIIFSFIFIALFLLFSSIRSFKLRTNINYSSVIVSMFFGTIITTYYSLPFFDILNNLGVRSSLDMTTFLKLDDFISLFNYGLTNENGQLFNTTNINNEFYISSLIFFLFLFKKNDKKNINILSFTMFFIFLILSTSNFLTNFLREIPGIDLISNWQRAAPFLVLTVILILTAQLDRFLINNNSRITLFLLLTTVLLSGISRINNFYNMSYPDSQSTYLTENIIRQNKSNPNIFNLDTQNSRAFSICNNNILEFSPNINLIYNNNIYWAGLYASFPNQNYTKKITSLSNTPPGAIGGRYFSHINGDYLDLSRLDQLNIQYLITSQNCNLDNNNLSLQKIIDGQQLYEVENYRPIIYTLKNGKYEEPEYMIRENPELITLRINNSSNLDYVYFSEIYNTSWKAESNGKSKEVIFNDGFMKVELEDGMNYLVLYFEKNSFLENIRSFLTYLNES